MCICSINLAIFNPRKEQQSQSRKLNAGHRLMLYNWKWLFHRISLFGALWIWLRNILMMFAPWLINLVWIYINHVRLPGLQFNPTYRMDAHHLGWLNCGTNWPLSCWMVFTYFHTLLIYIDVCIYIRTTEVIFGYNYTIDYGKLIISIVDCSIWCLCCDALIFLE